MEIPEAKPTKIVKTTVAPIINEKTNENLVFKLTEGEIKKVIDYVSSSKILTAKEAENIQIIDYYIESKKLEKFMYNYIRNFLEKSSPQSVEQIKKMLYNF